MIERASARGFTLIELMIALLVSSLLVGMILAIFSRMSLAYRGQQQIAGVQQVLAAARATIEIDAKQAGFGMSQGFTTAMTGPAPVQSPVQIIDSNAGPDQIAFFYADANFQALVTGFAAWPAVTVDAAAPFNPGNLVVLSTVSTTANPIPPGNRPQLALYTACVLQIAPGGIAGNTITFTTAAPWGSGGEAHCQVPTANRTMMYAFVAHAYQIDTSTPARAALGPLQQSLTGGLLGVNENWNELAYGFTDIQTAVRVWQAPAGDPDGDGDVNRDWFSGPNQNALSTVPPVPPGLPTPAPPYLLQMSISLVARTDRDVEGIATAQTPLLTVAGQDNNNLLGNRGSIALPAQPPWLADPALQGSRIYRYVTFQVDFRNLGIGL